LLTTILVNTFDDLPVPLAGRMSLRAAVAQAAISPGDDTIQVPKGTYNLDLGQAIEINDPSGKVTISGPDTTWYTESVDNDVTIQARGINRVFTVDKGSRAEFDCLDLKGGNASWGGGIENLGDLHLVHVELTKNHAQFGGGIWNSGKAVIDTESQIFENRARSHGGGIYNLGILELHDSDDGENSAVDGGGGATNARGGVLTFVSSSVGENQAGDQDHTQATGGGIENSGLLSLSLTDVWQNQASGKGGAIFNLGIATILGNAAPDEFDRTGIALNSAPVGGAIYNGQWVSQAGTPDPSSGKLELDGMHVLKNQANQGGGLYNDANATATLGADDSFTDNRADYQGGAIDNLGVTTVGSPELSPHDANRFADNSARYYGGGIVNTNGGWLQVYHASFVGNSATDSIGGSGGGIANLFANAKIVASQFTYNRAVAYGGGIVNTDLSPPSHSIEISGCGFNENHASFGGGMANSGPAKINACLFAGNSATYDGGGLWNSSAPLSIQNSAFKSNTAKRGGGLFSRGPLPTVVSTLFTGNSPIEKDIQ
jgi:hypothetical protein